MPSQRFDVLRVPSALIVSAALALAVVPARADAPWKLLGSADLALGQYYFNKSAGSLNGYSDVGLQQARSFSSRSGLYFDEHSIYTGFKQVDELAGGGTLFQQSLDNSVGMKLIHRFDGGYSLMPRVSVRNELFRETADEQWGKGLYDFWEYGGGLSWERKTRMGLSAPWTYSLAYDFYYTHYPRFRSLATQFGSALAAPDPGDHVLDTVTNQLTYRSDIELPNFEAAWLMYSLALADFTQQKLVNSQDQYLNSLRSDAFQSLGLGFSKRFADVQSLGRLRPTGALAVTLNDLTSNQNNFDTDQAHLKYIGNYYNYWEAHVTPSLSTFFLFNQMTAAVSYDLGYRAYTGRLAQNSDGTYTAGKLTQLSHTVSFDLTYPVLRGLAVRARALWSSSASNTHYESVYRYNYSSFNYFGGVEWRL